MLAPVPVSSCWMAGYTTPMLKMIVKVVYIFLLLFCWLCVLFSVAFIESRGSRSVTGLEENAVSRACPPSFRARLAALLENSQSKASKALEKQEQNKK